MGNMAWNGVFAIKSKYVNMPIKGGQGKTIILCKKFINKFYAAGSCVNKDLSINLLTILLKTAVNGYIIISKVRVCNI